MIVTQKHNAEVGKLDKAEAADTLKRVTWIWSILILSSRLHCSFTSKEVSISKVKAMFFKVFVLFCF